MMQLMASFVGYARARAAGEPRFGDSGGYTRLEHEAQQVIAGDRMPRTGDRLTASDGTVLEIVDASPRRVRSVRLHPPKAADDAAAEERGAGA